jgi:L-fucono-1,5-lactonase
MRIDAHHHFWQLSRFTYPWMGPELNVLRRDFGPGDLEPLLKRNGFEGSILVQTISSLEETKHFLDLARQHPFIRGVVGWVDLKDAGLGDTLDELLALPGLVGIRHQVHDEPDLDWLLREDVQRGLGEVARRRLVYDLLIRPVHLEVVLQVVRRFPGLRFVVDHLAKPRITARGWDDWAGGLAALAACPNVTCKLSGMITEADWASWQPADLKPYLDHALSVFGPDRVLFGSDWPVCLLAGSYDRVVNALALNLSRLTPAEQGKIFGANAGTVYGLDAPV